MKNRKALVEKMKDPLFVIFYDLDTSGNPEKSEFKYEMLTLSDWIAGAKKYDPFVTDEELDAEFQSTAGGDPNSKYAPTLFLDKFKILWANALKRQELNRQFNTVPGYKDFYMADKEPRDQLLDFKDFIPVAKKIYPNADPDHLKIFFKNAQSPG